MLYLMRPENELNGQNGRLSGFTLFGNHSTRRQLTESVIYRTICCSTATHITLSVCTRDTVSDNGTPNSVAASRLCLHWHHTAFNMRSQHNYLFLCFSTDSASFDAQPAFTDDINNVLISSVLRHNTKNLSETKNWKTNIVLPNDVNTRYFSYMTANLCDGEGGHIPYWSLRNETHEEFYGHWERVDRVRNSTIRG